MTLPRSSRIHPRFAQARSCLFVLSRDLPTLSLLMFLRSKSGPGPTPAPGAASNPFLYPGEMAFAQIAHSLCALLAAILGGALACAFFASRTVRPERPEAAARGTNRVLGKPWLRPAILGLVGLVLFGSVVVSVRPRWVSSVDVVAWLNAFVTCTPVVSPTPFVV